MKIQVIKLWKSSNSISLALSRLYTKWILCMLSECDLYLITSMWGWFDHQQLPSLGLKEDIKITTIESIHCSCDTCQGLRLVHFTIIEMCTLCSTLKFQRCTLYHITSDDRRATKGIKNATKVSKVTLDTIWPVTVTMWF